MTTTLKENLQQLYNDQSKHANYQNIPAFIREALGYTETINEEWRGDTARYNLLQRLIDFAGLRTVGDVGANTGFFTLSLAHQFPATRFIAYENNPNHVNFMQQIAAYFQMANVEVKATAVDLSRLPTLPPHDLLLHLNVLHHAGHDFDQQLVPDVATFYPYGRSYLAQLAATTKTIFFQMGSNWCGNKATPIIPVTDDTAKIFYLARMFRESGWRIAQVALPTRSPVGEIVYALLPGETTAVLNQPDTTVLQTAVADFVHTCNPDQFVGEFYRRPIFLCHSAQRT
jgi:hypothetical protein